MMTPLRVVILVLVAGLLGFHVGFRVARPVVILNQIFPAGGQGSSIEVPEARQAFWQPVPQAQEARDVGHEFTEAWNAWAPKHDPAKISRSDIKQWRLIQEKFHRLEDRMRELGY